MIIWWHVTNKPPELMIIPADEHPAIGSRALGYEFRFVFLLLSLQKRFSFRAPPVTRVKNACPPG